jgi:hypothetical protein
MLSAEALTSLAEAESLLAQTADAILRLAPGPAADFAGYVWFVLTALDELQGLPHLSNVSNAVERLLGFEQMDAALRERWMAFAAAVRNQYLETDPERRRRWTATGTTLGTAARLEEIVKDLVSFVSAAYPGLLNEDETPTELSTLDSLACLDSAHVFDALLKLPEADRAWRFRSRRGKGESLEVPLVPALVAWLSGTDITKLAHVMLPTIADSSWRLEHTVDAVSSAFEHYFSWMVGIVVEQANSEFEAANATVRLRPDLAALIRYGVDTSQALGLLTNGIQSRPLAYRLGRLADDRGMDLEELRDWLAELPMQNWRSDLNATPREVLDLLEFSRARRQSLLRTLLESGSAEVKIRLTTSKGESEEVGSEAVQLKAGDRSSGEILVVSGVDPLGLVMPRDHTDVLDVLASGLDVATFLEGDMLYFTATI